MPATAKTAAQTWIRAELVGVPDSAFGPQLMIPADGVEFHGPDLVFHREGEVVYVTRPDQLRSLTWLGPTTDPERERRRAQWPNHGKRWTAEQREILRTQLLAAASWTEIAKTHGRSRTGVQQEAVKQGWVDAETLRPAAALHDDGGSPRGEMDVGQDSDAAEAPQAADSPRTAESSASHRVRIRPRRHDGQAVPDAADDAADDVADNEGAIEPSMDPSRDPAVNPAASTAMATETLDSGYFPSREDPRNAGPAGSPPKAPCDTSGAALLGGPPANQPTPTVASPRVSAPPDPVPADPPQVPSPISTLPVRQLGSYVTTSLANRATVPESSPGVAPPHFAMVRDPSARPAPPAIPHPREPDRTPPDPVREPVRLTPARPSGT